MAWQHRTEAEPRSQRVVSTKGYPPACCVSGGGSSTSPGALSHYRPTMLREGVARVPVRLRAAYSTNYFAYIRFSEFRNVHATPKQHQRYAIWGIR